MSWPEDDLLTDALDDDTDALAGPGNAREQLLAAVQKLQAVLAQAGEGAVLYTDQNDGNLAKLAANTFPAAQTVQTLNTALLLLAHTGAAPGILAEYRNQGTKRWSVRNTAAHAMQWLNGGDQPRFSVDQAAQLLELTQNDITYGGQSLLGVGFFESAEDTINESAQTWSVDHGLNAAPSHFMIGIRLTTGDSNYEAGDEIDLTKVNIDTADQSCWANDTQVGISYNNASFATIFNNMPDRNGGYVRDLRSGRWRLFARAWR